MEEVEDKHGEQKKEVNWHVSFVDIWNQQKSEAVDDDLEVLALGKYISLSPLSRSHCRKTFWRQYRRQEGECYFVISVLTLPLGG